MHIWLKFEGAPKFGFIFDLGLKKLFRLILNFNDLFCMIDITVLFNFLISFHKTCAYHSKQLSGPRNAIPKIYKSYRSHDIWQNSDSLFTTVWGQYNEQKNWPMLTLENTIRPHFRISVWDGINSELKKYITIHPHRISSEIDSDSG